MHPSTQAPDSPTPEGILLVENFIDADLCQMFCDLALTETPDTPGVISYEKTTEQEVAREVNLRARDCQRIPTESLGDVLQEIFFNMFTDHIEPFFGQRVEWWEKPQLLRYLPGGRYGAHADAEHWIAGEGGQGEWKRTLDRDISVLLYMNGAFTGGNLYFPNQQYLLRPRTGLLVAFPSTHLFKHEAQITESGVRYVMVSWAASEGVARVRPKPPGGSLYMKNFRKAMAEA
jgi:predicted 2-oxoglutarate/Fe(II)-dependent dioxygenase YbiX